MSERPPFFWHWIKWHPWSVSWIPWIGWKIWNASDERVNAFQECRERRRESCTVAWHYGPFNRLGYNDSEYFVCLRCHKIVPAASKAS